MLEYNIVLAGAAVQGVQTTAELCARFCHRLGYHLFLTHDYQSRVRGGHNFMRLRLADRPLAAAVAGIDMLLAFNRESLELYLPALKEGGQALASASVTTGIRDSRVFSFPEDLLPEAKAEKFVGVKLLVRFAVGVGFEPEVLKRLVSEFFDESRSKEILALNLEIIEVFSRLPKTGPVWLQPKAKQRAPVGALRLSGHAGLALGLVAGGLGLYAGYPMSPATSVMNYLAAFGKESDLVVEQVEDEIAALNVACGAAFAGLRAVTGTSGGGISLMTETVNLAGISETPVVIINAQRPGPATGMATRTEQSDLLQAVFAGQGEFPRAVLAPTGPENAFYLAAEALNLAEVWQLPVFVLTDQALGDAQTLVPEYDLERVVIDRGQVASEPESSQLLARYRLTESEISPCAYAGSSRWIVQQDSHEHTEIGRLSDDRENRVAQFDKRRRKGEGLAAVFPGPEIYGDDDGLLLLCWGSRFFATSIRLIALWSPGFWLRLSFWRRLLFCRKWQSFYPQPAAQS